MSQPIFTDERALDLLRYARHKLFDEELISPQEYADLVEDSQNGERVRRLETYDQMRATIKTLVEAIGDYRYWYDTCTRTEHPGWKQEAADVSRKLDAALTEARKLYAK